MSSVMIICPSPNLGGIERALCNLANEFVKKNICVHFLICLPGEMQYSLDNRVSVVRAGIPYQGKFGKTFFYPRLIARIRELTKRINPNKVLSFGDVFGPIVLLSLIGLKFPVYVSDRTSPDYRINPIADFLKTILYPKSAGFIAQTQRMGMHMKIRFNRRLNITVIPNAIKPIESSSYDNRQESILYVGRLSWEKGVDRLIKAFAQLKKQSWYLEIVGTGPLEVDYRSLVKDLGVIDKVIFHGLQKDPSRFYQRASIFVLPSHIEGFPNAMCEAMSAGLPVVCFDSIPFEAIIEPQVNGLVVKANDVSALTKSINALIEDKDLRIRMSESNSLRVKDFDSHNIAAKLIDFMDAQLN